MAVQVLRISGQKEGTLLPSMLVRMAMPILSKGKNAICLSKFESSKYSP
jgi:hypothetical protein